MTLTPEQQKDIRYLRRLASEIIDLQTKGRPYLYTLIVEQGLNPKSDEAKSWLKLFDFEDQMKSDSGEEQVESEHKETESDHKPTESYYSVAEAAEILGYEATGATIRRLCAASRVPGALKKGRLWLIPKSWVKEQQNTPPIGKGNRGVSRK